MRKIRLFTPGPTPLFPQVQEALSRPIIHHRTDAFTQILLKTRANLQKIYKTDHDVVILASSGTGAMEAAVANLVSPGEQALAVVAGKFGERWTEICKTHAISCAVLPKGEGEAASPQEIAQALEKHPKSNVLLIQGCETSTATSHDLEAIGRLLRDRFPDVLIVVDAITALLSQPVETDQWGLDVVISGSQKAFGLPAGLAFLSLSPRALKTIESRSSRPYYFDLLQEVKKQRTGQTAFTPAVSLIVALHDATAEILHQGADQVIAEAELMARCTRQGLLHLGFQLLSSSPANAATGAFPPKGISAADLSRSLKSHFGVHVAGGQGELKGKIIRIAHLGYFDLVDVFSVLSAIELTIHRMGANVEIGAGVRAAMHEAAGLLIGEKVGL